MMMKRKPNGAVITQVCPGSLGEELGLSCGDRLLAINSVTLQDLIDYTYLQAEEEIELLVQKADGEIWEIEVEKDEEESLGLNFDEPVFDGIIPCNNRCLFCFVDQMPAGQRSTLYVKDDDYRLSFLQGSYITLTNLQPLDWERIQKLRISPLYISVHATDPTVRKELLRHKKAGHILQQLEQLKTIGTRCHTQAVLCPGINDGLILDRTMKDLFALWPTVLSLAVVPVGLTSHRTGLPSISRFSTLNAKSVLDQIHSWQSYCLTETGTRWVWASDEFYLQAEMTLPPYESYEGFEQLENGVGLWRLFEKEFTDALERWNVHLSKAGGSYGVVTGIDAAGLWVELSDKLIQVAPGLKVDIYPIKNQFFGPEVTVTGLVVGRDIVDALRRDKPPLEQIIIIPRVMLRHGESVFLDGMTLKQLEAVSGYHFIVAEVDGESIIKLLCQYEEEN
jgi:putative radical SAM enzyme (TIGR03279 family)